MLIKKGGGGGLEASGLSLRLGKRPPTSVAAHRALPSIVCIPRLPDDDCKRVNPNRRPIGIPDDRQDNDTVGRRRLSRDVYHQRSAPCRRRRGVNLYLPQLRYPTGVRSCDLECSSWGVSL